MHDKLTRPYPANYDLHARSVAINAYWQQVKRTVYGQPLDEAQIALIVDNIVAGLDLRSDDVVLDLACGNGALSSRLFGRCRGLVGVDMSPYLVEIAQRDFARPPHYRFCVSDAVSYLALQHDVPAFTKVLIYCAFPYFSRADGARVLRMLGDGFATVTRVFIGELPNRRRADRFYRERIPVETTLDDHEAQIGVWYLPEEIAALARAAGWLFSCSDMPCDFQAAAYRFNATLVRP